jgi:hypothetical protein
MEKPSFKENLIGFVLVIIGTFAAIFIGTIYQIGYITGIPITSYGIYGLISKRLWLIGGSRGAPPGEFITDKRYKYLAIAYIIMGVFLSAMFYFVLTSF